MNTFTETITETRAQLAVVEREHGELRAALDKRIEEAKAEGVDFVKDEAKYQELKEKLGDPLQAKSNELQGLRERLAEFAQIQIAMGEAPDPRSNGPGAETKDQPTDRKAQSVGDVGVKRLVDSPQWRGVKDHIAERASSGYLSLQPVEIFTAEETKALLGDRASWEAKAAGDNVVTGASATSAGAGVINDFLARYVDLVPFAPNRLLDLIPKSTTDSDTIDYLTETAFTNAAAETAEATSGSDGALAEAAQTWARVQDSIQLVGHYIPATTRGLEDFGQLRSLVQRKLIGGLMNRLNLQCYSGNGTSPNISGFTDRSGYQTQALGTDSRSDAVLKAVLAIRTTASVNDNLDPAAMAVVFDPADWVDLRLEKDANGNYTYGPPSGPVGFSIWGMPVVQDMILTAGTGLVGSFDQCELFIRRGVTISSTDSHDDWFISEIIAIKATLRAALAVYKPAAFCGLTGF